MPQLVAATCPSCAAALEVDPGRDYATCQYCGTTSYLQKPQGPPPPPGQMTIMLNLPGAIPLQVDLTHPAAPAPGAPAPGAIPVQQQQWQAAQQAQLRVASAQLYAAQQMSNAYAQAGQRMAVGAIVAVVVPIAILIVVGLVVALAFFLGT